MAGLSTRSRRSQVTNDEIGIVQYQVVKEEPKGKIRYSRTSRVLTVSVSSDQSGQNILNELAAPEPDSSVNGPPSSEEFSSNTSESGKSDKSLSEASATSDGSISKKTKDELIKSAHDLDAQLQELIKIYMDEKKIFIDKSIHLLETESHPDWLEKLEELRSKHRDATKTANERHRLKVDSILAEYDFALKNVSDEFDAAENEIIDEFTTKRRRKSLKEENKFNDMIRSENTAQPNFNLEAAQIQDDISTINQNINSLIPTRPTTTHSL